MQQQINLFKNNDLTFEEKTWREYCGLSTPEISGFPGSFRGNSFVIHLCQSAVKICLLPAEQSCRASLTGASQAGSNSVGLP